jgi:hypothetical protein
MEVPLALSIHKFVNSVGADAGFAAFICVAVIGLLYFAQARETATLRDRLEDAHQRIGGLESRIAQLMHLQSTRKPVPQSPVAPPVRVTPPPVGSRPTGNAIASVRRIPAATAAGTTAPLTSTSFPFAPMGMGAPALASATKLIPDPVVAPAAAAVADAPVGVPTLTGVPVTSAAAASAAPGASELSAAADASTATASSPLPLESGHPEDTMVVPPAVVAAGNGKGETPGRPVGTPPRAAVGTTPPRVQIRPDAGAAATPRRTVTSPARPVGEARFDVFENDRGGSRWGGRRLPLAIVALAVVVIIGGVVAITQSGNSTTNSTVGHRSGATAANSKSTSGSRRGGKHKAVPFSPSKVTVAVLNGTAVGGLAADVAKVLSGAGYKTGSVTNAASQAQRATVVYFVRGRKSDADHVASQLKLKSSSVQPATRAAIHSCATSATTSATTSCHGNVIVSVGQDRASLASSASSSAG